VRGLLWFVAVIALLIAVDSAARSYASNQIEGRLATVLQSDEPPKVAIGGFPFIVSAIDGEFETVSISADRPGWESGPVKLSDVNLTLSRVEFSPSEMLRDELRRIRVGSARGTARVDVGVLSAALPSGARVPIPEEGELPIEDNRLRIGPATLPLPLPLEGMSFERAEIVGDSVELEFTLNRTTFPVG
jgi:hypothetical protein